MSFKSFIDAVSLRSWGTDPKIKEVKSVISKMQPEVCRDEEEFEKQVYQWLRAKEYTVFRQFKHRNGRRIDLVCDNIAIELKTGESVNNLQRLLGQIMIYSEFCGKILVVILDNGMVNDMVYYINKVKSINPNNIDVLVLKGEINRRHQNE